MIDDDGLNDKDSTCKYTGGERDNNLNILGAAEIINLELLQIFKKYLNIRERESLQLKYTGGGRDSIAEIAEKYKKILIYTGKRE